MRRTITALLTAAMLTVPLAAPVAAGNQDRCTEGEVRSLHEAGPQAFRQFFGGLDTNKAASVSDCQFRLYDDNGPTVAHVFTTEDWFLAGIFEFVERDILVDNGLTRADGIAYLNQLNTRFSWGPEGGPLVEMPLTESSPRNFAGPPFGWAVYILYSHTFSPGSVAPGDYEWRYEFSDPLGFQPTVDITGAVRIVDA